MGMQNIEGYGTFRKMDKQSVIGFLKKAGTRDPDVLSLHKQKLIAPNKNLKIAGFGLMGCGAILTITIILAIVGVPVVLIGVWMWRFSVKNIAVVEEAYGEYLASSPA